MKSIDNTKLIRAIEKYAFHRYLERLVKTELRKVALFPVFPQTGAPNLSDPARFLLVDDLSKIAALNSGSYFN